jgi:cobalt-zinc-cadmium efflux system membrane fusion protein
MIKQIGITFFALLTIITFIGCDKQDSIETETLPENEQSSLVKLSQQSIKEIGLQTEKVSRQSFTSEMVIPAKILANQDYEALVGSLVQGRACKVFVKVGDIVKAGQDLMLVEGLEIGGIKAQFLSAKANLEYQKSNFERQKKLLDENVGSQKTFLEVRNEYDKALAEYIAEENRIKAIHLSVNEVISSKDQPASQDFGTLPVKSPINGIVVERNVVIGQSIDQSANAFRIINLSTVWIDGQIYEKDIDKISQNAAVVFTSPAFPNEIFKGKITYTGQVVDEKTRTITIRAEFSNANGKLKPQMFGELRIPNTKAEVIALPSEALIKMDNADFVFVKKNSEEFERIPVSIGSIQNELAEIKSGLNEGDIVAVKGSSYLKAEMMKASLGEGE